MSSMLKRQMAPITPEAWAEIDAQAADVLRGNLSGRKVVDLDGPHGLTFAAVNIGGVEPASKEAGKGVQWGTRKVQPLIEVRIPFELGIWDLDDISRGSKTAELKPVVEAAEKAAAFEDQALYNGFKDGGISGILQETENKAIALPAAADSYPKAVEDAVHAVQSHGIGGPFNLVLGRTPYQKLSVGDQNGYPLKSRILDLLGGGIFWSPALKGGVVVSGRGGDFELTVGQDLSIGFQRQQENNVVLYITESFTFRVLEPAAGVELKAAGK